MNSSRSIPSIVGGLLTRFCFPLTKMIMNSCRRFLRSLFSAALSFRLRFAMTYARSQKQLQRFRKRRTCNLLVHWSTRRFFSVDSYPKVY